MRRRLLSFAFLTALAGGVAGAAVFGGAAPADPPSFKGAPVREQNLDANGFIRVHEQGTSSVVITNTPVPVAGNLSVINFPAVQAVEPTKREPFHVGSTGNIPVPFPPGQLAEFVTFDVPAGKRLWIEYLSVNCFVPAPERCRYVALDVGQRHHFPVVEAGEGWVASTSVSLAAQGTVQVTVFRGLSPGPGGSFVWAVSGYLVDM